MRRIAFVTIIAVAALSATSPAQAKELAERSYEVSYRDLNLMTQSGRDALDDRLRVAVARVCGNVDIRRLDEFADYRQCREAARESADSQRTIALARQGTPGTLRVAVTQK